MLSKKGFLFVLIFTLLLAACASSGRSADLSSVVEAPMEPVGTVGQGGEFLGGDGAAEFATSDEDGGFGVATNRASVEQQAQGSQERLIIRTADLNLIVTDTEATIGAISEMVEANGGWVVNSSLYQYGEDAKSGNITVRVPVEGFNSAITAIKALAERVTSETSAGQDVTEEYVDLSARLANLEATANRVRNFLDETKNVEEALAVNQELSRLEGEIEVIKGRMQYLSQSAGFSTISVNLTPDIAIQPLSPENWQPGVVARESFEALVNTLQHIVNFLIGGMILLVPLALIVGVPLWLIIRYALRWRRRQAVAIAEQ